jgi:hypothetical protein
LRHGTGMSHEPADKNVCATKHLHSPRWSLNREPVPPPNSDKSRASAFGVAEPS